MGKEIKTFILLVGLFLLFFYMPTQSALFIEALLSGVTLLHEYAREHVLTCLVPAFFIAGAMSVFVKKDVILMYLGGKASKLVSYSLASVSGAVLAVCSCTILPLFAGIRKRGAGLGPAITFLFSGPAINIAAVFLTFSVLGTSLGIARVTSAIFLSIVVGISMQLIFREKTEEGGLFVEQTNQPSYSTSTVLFFMLAMVGVLVVNGLPIDVLPKYILMSVLVGVTVLIAVTKFQRQTNREWLEETWSFTKLLLPILFIGVFFAGFVMPFLPQELIETLVGTNSIIGNATASIFGAFMYFSTLTEIPILQALIAKGMNEGPALALLLAGPSLSLPNMLVVRSVLGNKKTIVYVLLVIIYSTLAGYAYGLLL